ncbi:MAG: alpha/beta fold hydrolase [Planctomycetota bacterium]|jgi:pimeloyl-ACP methyl ester carboxylesterase
MEWPAFWDPLFWWLLIKSRSLKKRGFRRGRARLGEGRFSYYLRGNGHVAPPLMLVHGMAVFPEWWSALFERFNDSRPVCALELLGFGRSPGRGLEPDAFTLALYRKQIAYLKKKLGWKKMILAGVSLGGWICLDYALAHPEDVAGMVLIAPAGTDSEISEEDLNELRRLFDYRNPEEFNHLINNYVLRKPQKIPWIVGYLAVKRARWNGHKHLLNNLKPEDWIGERVKAIEAPAALIWGRQDKVFPIEVGEATAARMPSARIFPLENAGHSYLFEQPGPTSAAFMEGLRFIEASQK